MEGPLSVTAWLMMLVMAVAGSGMYFFARPYDGSKYKVFGMCIVSAISGVGSTPAICEFNGWSTVYQHMIVSFFAALLSMPVCKGAIAVAESESVNWIKERILGKSTKSKEPPQDDGPYDSTLGE